MKPTAETDSAPSSPSPSAAGARGTNGNGVHALGNGTHAANGTNGTNGIVPRAKVAPAAPKSNGDWIPLVAAIGRHWVWVVAVAVVFTVVGVLVARKLWATGYTAGAQLVRYDTPDAQLFKPREIAAATLASMIGSTEVRARVGERANPQLSASEVGSRVYLMPERQSDIINITFTGSSPEEAIALANIYADESVRFTQQMQTRDATEAASYLKHQLDKVTADLAELNKKFEALGPAGIAAASGAPSVLQTRLEEARLELADMLGRYRENHPAVQEQQARVAALEKQAGPVAEASEAAPAGAAGQYEMLRDAHRALDAQRMTLTNRLQLTQMLSQNPPGYYRLFSPASNSSITTDAPTLKVAAFALFLGLCGLMLGAAGAVTDELMDRRLKTPADVRRVTRLPLLATLGSIDKMSSAARQRWAFRTWTALQSRLSISPNQGLVCGVTSSGPGEGRSLWIKLLSEAASQCGFRVITITTRPHDDKTDAARRHEARPARASGVRVNGAHGEVKSAEPVLIHETTLNDSMLNDPDESVEQMLAPEGSSIVHLPLPGWVGNLERRKQWLTSLNAWGTHENVVIFVELPPASTSEAVLLAQNLPNVVWLTDGTRAEALETSRQIETLRHARCNLVGAVMNRNTVSQLQERFARWIPATATALMIGLMIGAPAEARAQTVTEAPASFSIVSPEQRAMWQRDLTLGPGDVLRIALYGEPTLTRSEVQVQPDGRISFLEARDIVAAGLTIDQLRVKFDQALGEFRRAPRTMISPVEFRSKKYYMLGQVAEKGSFTLDRPMTVLEAVARARGFETSMSGGDVVDSANLSHAFLVRNGQRRTVNFEKLFNEGDLSQNIAVEPGDYFFFPPADLREVYVLGEVAQPGPATFTGESTTLRAVAARGGFTSRAWQNRVLIVRGSLNNPKPVVVNLADVLTGRANDVQLEPRDIVYVSAKPWWKAEELLDEAASAFAQSLVVYWTSDKVIPVVPLR